MSQYNGNGFFAPERTHPDLPNAHVFLSSNFPHFLDYTANLPIPLAGT